MKTIENKKYIECLAILLPTIDDSDLGIYDGKLYNSTFGSKCDNWNSQHLYILSDVTIDELKENDWVMNSASLTGFMKVGELHTEDSMECVQEEGKHAMCVSYDKDGNVDGAGDIPLDQLLKIIATTNPELIRNDLKLHINEIIDDSYPDDFKNFNRVPQISNDFIEEYVKNPVEYVFVEVEEIELEGFDAYDITIDDEIEYKTKISTENTVSIKLI